MTALLVIKVLWTILLPLAAADVANNLEYAVVNGPALLPEAETLVACDCEEAG